MTNNAASFKNVAILRPGRFTDSAGRSVEFTAQQLFGMAQNFDPQSFRPPLTLDHEDSGPASGSISALRWDGSFLRADIDDVAGELASQIESGRWPFRSAEVYADSGSGHSLRALSLLGARPPAVKGLPGMPPPQKPGKGAGPPSGVAAVSTKPISLDSAPLPQPRNLSLTGVSDEHN